METGISVFVIFDLRCENQVLNTDSSSEVAEHRYMRPGMMKTTADKRMARLQTSKQDGKPRSEGLGGEHAVCTILCCFCSVGGGDSIVQPLFLLFPSWLGHVLVPVCGICFVPLSCIRLGVLSKFLRFREAVVYASGRSQVRPVSDTRSVVESRLNDGKD